MAKRPPTINALHADTGNRIGNGQDNLVHALDPKLESLVNGGDWVVKIGHKKLNEARQERWKTGQAKEAVLSGVAYKQNKYDILKHFLGKHTPESIFLASTVEEGGIPRPAEITLQRRLPVVHLRDLSPEQKQDPRLMGEMLDVFNRLKYMYSIIGEVNSRTSDGVSLDAKLDLSGISSFVSGERFDYQFTEEDAQQTINSSPTKNILVDPADMSVYCVDFDQGDWTKGMAEAKDLLFNIDAHRHELAAEMSHRIMRGYVEPPTLVN